MRVLVIGRSGELATALQETHLPDGWVLQALGRPELDVRKQDSILGALDACRPDVVINTAAYTAVDDAEDNVEEAFTLNRDAPAMLARECARYDIPLVHISTDYVFSGHKQAPHVETDDTDPVNIYGRSKLAGEIAIRAVGGRFCIVRTAWLFGAHGCNFLRTILERAKRGKPLRIVQDQRGNPTCATHLAEALMSLLIRWQQAPERFPWNRVWHLAGSGEATWLELAEAIMDASRQLGGPSVAVFPISTSEYPTRAKRPVDSRLDCSAIAKALDIQLPHWQLGVELTVQTLLGKGGPA